MQEFFETFGIEPKICTLDKCRWTYEEFDSSCNYCQFSKNRPSGYPEITAEILLELIIILSGVMPVKFAFERSIDDVKTVVLNYAINYKKRNINHFYDIDEQVRKLFK